MWTFDLSLSFLLQIGLLITLALGSLKAYLLLKMEDCKSTNKLTGKTVIITGANTGIGKETAIDLAKRGARVVLACRNLDKASAAKDDIIRESGNANVVVRHLDLASLKSVRKFADEIIKNEPRLDILVNNAGCVVYHDKLTEDGLAYHMQTNHLGHFLLMNLLLGLLKKSAPSRIVCTASMAHGWTKSLDVENLHSEFSYTSKSTLIHEIYLYVYSKLSPVLCTRHLAPLIFDSGVTINCLCPGVVYTDVFRNTYSWFQMIVTFAAPYFLKTAKQGAQTNIHLAVSDEVAGITGEYFTSCKVTDVSKLAKDAAVAKKVWEMCETLVKLQPEERHY
ncbi:retinol dehydrogenase 12-like [Daphnia pulex]|uniref:retinol dehydrogenase 12-like n=1 Tax=Daphnia pulex TaxID=6669 RepID=UPI001EE0E5EE|nr:retinol dehydrogenase 12-like [Daphnia pulex]